ncbi:ABC transporter substrate-binding protein [Dethiosulfatarculus sandiegensis]|uniref:ABC transporter substrate-binding protein n=1 Tax=Dethiosulfatarculus sandiegensis TaxID=1429043 RepID=UPI0012E1961F|nr:ABC transporter substrate-binding protein [Dethiosulfatarculus sandiegensis]
MIPSLSKATRTAFFILALCVGFCLSASAAQAATYKKIEKKNLIIIGDRVVDIAYNLGVIPVGLSARCSMWPMCEKIKVIGQPVGCPGCVSKGKTAKLKKLIKQKNIKLALVEKSDPFCILVPKANPLDAIKVFQKMGVKVITIDFKEGIPSAIQQTAAALGKKEQGAKLKETYEKNLTKLNNKMKNLKIGKKVVVLNGVYQAATGKSFIRVEVPGGYTDRFILTPLGCQNVGGALVKGRKAVKGYVGLRKLKGLSKNKPDVIVITGDATGVQKALTRQVANDPELGKVPVYSLPGYIDSSVIEKPAIVSKWIWALK